MAQSLIEREREVQDARAKLAADLTILRSPEALTAFTDSVKHEAFAAKDVAIQRAKDAAQTSFEGLIDDLKAKAAANPAAVLIIGAGIAWRLIRNPPISTAVVGAGLFSLWRTKTVGPARQDNRDYLEQGKQQFKKQMEEFGSEAASVASNVGQALSEKTGRLYDTAKEKLQGWSHDATDATIAAASSARTHTDGLAASAVRTFHDALDQVEGAATRTSDAVARVGGTTVSSLSNMAGSAREVAPTQRDSLLLGVAGAAVAAAVGIALQKRIAAKGD
jgi:hypothetical protein